MAFCQDDVVVGGQLKVGAGICPAIKEGDQKINGSAFIEGPAVFGSPTQFAIAYATVMIGPLVNADPDSVPPFIPGALCTGINNPYSLCVTGDAAIFDNLDVAQNIAAGNNIIAQGEVMSRCGSHILSAKKNFDIPHPTKEGWRLRHTCPEGPSNDVYYRGRITSRKEIILPTYWENLVDPTTITVNLTPIGAHQDVIVKRIGENKVFLQSKGGMPIDCYYHIFAERKDGEKLIAEYEGTSAADYPGNNDEYSVSGYHYDIKEV
jgi:hypothetical protein